MIPSEPSRSPLSVGVEWASRVMTIGLEFALPALGGVWLDRRLGTGPWMVLVGSGLGFAAGMVHLLRIGREGSRIGTRGGPAEGLTEEKRDGRA